MRRLLIVICIAFIVFTSCKGRSNNKDGGVGQVVVESEALSDVDAIKEPEVIEEKSLFESLVDKIPVTPLPFGTEGLADMLYYNLPSPDIYDNLWRDSLNSYGMNYFFIDNEEIAVEYISDSIGFPLSLYEIFSIDKDNNPFFSHRFPPKDGHEYLLFNTSYPNKSGDNNTKWDSWYLVECNKNGAIMKYVDKIGAASDRYLQLFYIEKNHNVKYKVFGPPRTHVTLSTGTMGYRVNEEEQVDTTGCSILWYDNKNEYIWVFNRPERLVDDGGGGSKFAPDSGVTDEELRILIHGKLEY